MNPIFVICIVFIAKSVTVNSQDMENFTDYNMKKMKTIYSTNLAKKTRCENADVQAPVLTLLDHIVTTYLLGCTNVVLYEKDFELETASLNFDLLLLLSQFKSSYVNGQINRRGKVFSILFEPAENRCRNYILLLSDVTMVDQVMSDQMTSKVVVVTSSTRWKIEDYLVTQAARRVKNLLIISNTGTEEFLIRMEEKTTKRIDINLYTHELYVDAVGSSTVKLLTAWRCGHLTREVDLFPSKVKRGFNGRQFVVSVSQEPPFILKKNVHLDEEENQSQIWDGLEMRLLRMLTQYLNYTLEIKESKLQKSQSSGASDVVVSEIADHIAEIGAAGIYMTTDRLAKVGFSPAHSVDCAAFVTRTSTALPRYRAILGPFQWTVWLTLTLTYMLAILPLSFTYSHSLTYLVKHPWQIENMFWYVFGTFTNCFTFTGEKSWTKSKKNATRLLIGWYWAFTIIVTACYTGSIVSFITLFIYPEMIDRVDQLVKDNFRIGSLTTGGWGSMFNESEHELTRWLLRDIELIPNTTQGLKNLTRSFYLPMFRPYAFLAGRAHMEYIIKANYTTEKRKEMMHISKECFVPFSVSLIFPKNAVFKELFDEFVLRSQQSGLISKLLNEFKWEFERSSSGKLLQASSGIPLRSSDAMDRKLTLDDTQGMYLLMAAGYLIAFFVMMCESGHFSFVNRKILSCKKSLQSLTFWRHPILVDGCEIFISGVLEFFEPLFRSEANQKDAEYPAYKKYDSRVLYFEDRKEEIKAKALHRCLDVYYSEFDLNEIEKKAVKEPTRSLPNLARRRKSHTEVLVGEFVNEAAGFTPKEKGSINFGSIGSLPWEIGKCHFPESFSYDRPQSS